MIKSDYRSEIGVSDADKKIAWPMVVIIFVVVVCIAAGVVVYNNRLQKGTNDTKAKEVTVASQTRAT